MIHATEYHYRTEGRLSCYSSNLLVTVKRVLITQWTKQRVQPRTYNAIISTPSEYITGNHDWFVNGRVFPRKHRFGSEGNREKKRKTI